MILPDVNVLIPSFRRDSARHSVCKAWLDRLVRGDAQFAISPLTLSALIRITTNPRIYVQPSPVEEAIVFCDSLLNEPHCEIVHPGPRHWRIFQRMCVEAGVRGPLTTDAWFAALAIEHGCTWMTFDRGYARFPGLDWREPAG